jgi:hypothetical protein
MSPFDHPVALTLFGFAVLSVAFIVYEVRRAPLRPSEPSSWDVLDGVGRRHCSVRGCDTIPTVNVHAGRDWWPFCAEHGTPYLLDPDRDLTHTEAREVHDDARRITGEAARRGGGA